MPPHKNPFEFGRELTREELVDRRDELNTVVRAIENRGKLFLIGPRRFGKTSLIHAAEIDVEQKGDAVVLREDAERYESLDLMAQALLTAATRRLATTVERAGDLLKRFASGLKPELTYDPEDLQFGISLGKRSTSKSELPILVDVFDTIEKMAAGTGRSVTIVIDEFQQIVSRGGVATERQIRSAIQRHRHVGYIFAGSATRMLADMTGDQNRPFYKLGDRLFLGRIPREEFLAFLRTGFESAGFQVGQGALEHLLMLADEVPYSVQYLAHVAWEMVRSGKKQLLTIAGVDLALGRVLDQTHPNYVQIWNGLTIQQKKVARAVALEGGEQLLSAAVAARHKVPIATMQSGLRTLLERTLFQEEVSVGGGSRYRLEDPLFGAWIRNLEHR